MGQAFARMKFGFLALMAAVLTVAAPQMAFAQDAAEADAAPTEVADATGAAEAGPLSDQQEWHWSASPGFVRDWNSSDDILLEASKPIHLVTGIARPKRVIADLHSLGFNIAQYDRFADHHAYTQQDVQQLMQKHRSIVTTAKDAVKLIPLWPCDMPLWVLEQQIEAEDGLARQIVKIIRAKA